jgi:carboxypeptidase family protein/TonB-dependent receptor-like protein
MKKRLNGSRSLVLTAIATMIVCLLFYAVSLAQRTTATYSGIVVDPSDRIIPGAAVELRNENTSQRVSQVTNDDGEFVFNYLPIGVYTLRITAPGFKLFEEHRIELSAAQNVRRRLPLAVGAMSESVTVTAEEPQVNAISPEQRTNYETREIDNLPLTNRNVSRLLEVNTGLVRDAGAPGAGGGRVRLNGLGGSSVRVTANGTDASGNAGAPGLSQYLQINKIDVMSIEAVGELQVVKGVVPAEYGPAMGGNVNLITKSGTNEFHGSLFHRYEGAALDARQQFSKAKENRVWNQYGGSLGGPMISSRAFFFVAYEGYQEFVPRLVTGNVPTQKFRDMILNALPFPETQLNLAAFPLPTEPTGANDLIGIYRASPRQISKDDHFDSRGDVRLWGGNLSATYTRGHPFFLQPRVEAVNARVFNSRTDRFNTSYILGRGRFTSETRYGYNKNYLARLDEFLNTKDPAKDEAIPFYRRVTGIRFTGMDNVGGAELHVRGLAPTHSFEQQFAVFTGKHSIKFGGLFMRPAGSRPDAENGWVAFQTLTDLLNNRPSQVAVTFGVNENIWSMKQFGFFLQDDWRVSQKLVLNLGLRYDFFGKAVARPTNPNNPAGYFNRDGLLDSQFNFGPIRDPLDPYQNDAMNFGPRFGFAYNVGGRGNTIVRGGFGIMFQSLDPQMLETGFSNSAIVPFRRQFSAAEAARYGLKFPFYNEDVLPLVNSLNQIGANDVINPGMEAPYAMNFSLGIQRALTPSLVLETSFVGTRGVKFVLTRSYNTIDRLTGLRPNPNLGQALYHDNSQQSAYYSWQTQLRKRMSRNFMFNVSYTYGKGMAYTGGDISRDFNGDTTNSVQDFFDVKSEHSPSAGDISHLFVANWLYDVPTLPFAQNSGLGRAVLGGWELTGIFRANTGQPFDVEQTSQSPGSRPDVIDPANTINRDCCGSSLQYLNPAAFQLVPVSGGGATIRRGNIGHNALRVPGFWNIDIAVSKNIRLPIRREGTNLEIRADLLNAFNHTNYTAVSGSINSRNFGQVTNTTGARTVQLQARISF